MKRNLMFTALIAALLFSFTPFALANHGEGRCPMGKSAHCKGSYEHGQKSPCPITNQFLGMAHEALEHQKDLGLSADQVKAIRELKIEAMKRSVRQMADMQILMIDMKSKMKADVLDVKGLNDLIDKGSATMAASTKETVKDYDKFLKVLTDEQRTKLKSVR